jgi:hypothetical protein
LAPVPAKSTPGFWREQIEKISHVIAVDLSLANVRP